MRKEWEAGKEVRRHFRDCLLGGKKRKEEQAQKWRNQSNATCVFPVLFSFSSSASSSAFSSWLALTPPLLVPLYSFEAAATAKPTTRNKDASRARTYRGRDPEVRGKTYPPSLPPSLPPTRTQNTFIRDHH